MRRTDAAMAENKATSKRYHNDMSIAVLSRISPHSLLVKEWARRPRCIGHNVLRPRSIKRIVLSQYSRTACNCWCGMEDLLKPCSCRSLFFNVIASSETLLHDEVWPAPGCALFVYLHLFMPLRNYNGLDNERANLRGVQPLARFQTPAVPKMSVKN